MARSFNRLPITGNCKCRSERWDKKFWHRRFRIATRQAIHRGDELMPIARDVSNVWTFGKDGKTYWADWHMALSDYPIYQLFGK